MADDEGCNKRPVARRRMPDVVNLVAGVGAVGLGITALVGTTAWLPPIDIRWLLAGGALLIGVLLLAGSLRSRRQ